MTVTLLFTDIEGSTALFEQSPDAYQAALRVHHEMLRREIAAHGGHEFQESGDGFLVAFERASDALACAVAVQRALNGHAWPPPVGALQVRMALHSGETEFRDGQYRGLALNRASRILAAAHGGQILCSGPAAALLAETGTDFQTKKLGIFRLRGLAEPERLFQIGWEGMPRAEFPPPAAAAAHSHNLPAQLTRFFGREAELDRLEKMLQPGGPRDARLVTLAGPGGTGKTRLSIAAAERVLDAWSHAVTFVPLADIADPQSLPDALRDALKIPRIAAKSSLDQAVEFLAARPSLVVFDNFEQLAAGGADFVLGLLRRVPSMVCLVTSRQKLAIPGEREFPVAPLSKPEPLDAPDQLRGNESVQLFVNRAQAVRADFDLTQKNAPDVAALCRMLEGIPLAIELAAARAQILTPGEMVAQMRGRFDLLADETGQHPARHRTLWAAIDWSYESLMPEARRFFLCLSPFRGGWTAEAAAFVAGELPSATALNHLYHLRSCSFLVVEESGEGMRYRMLETLRQYAGEQLAREADAASVRERHCYFFEKMAGQAEGGLGSPEQAVWLARLEIEHDNVRAALAGMSVNKRRLRMAVGVHRFWMVRGYAVEGLRWLNHTTPEGGPVPDIGIAITLSAVGNLNMSIGDLGAARDAYSKALPLFRAVNEPRNVAAMQVNLGILAAQQGDYDEARRSFEECLPTFRELGSERKLAAVLSNLGTVAFDQRDFAAAHRYLGESLSLRHLQEPFGIAMTLNTLGLLAFKEGDFTISRRHFLESLVLCRQIGEKSSLPVMFEGIAEMCAADGDPNLAARLLSAAGALRQETQSTPSPLMLEYTERTLAILRQAMEQPALDEAWQSGEKLTLDEVIASLEKGTLQDEARFLPSPA